jgi:hypothetical protein
MNKKMTPEEEEIIYRQIVEERKAKKDNNGQFVLISESSAVELRKRLTALNSFRTMSLSRSSKRISL